MTTAMNAPSPFAHCQAFLLAEFIILHLAEPPANELINFLGTVEAILWLQVCLIHDSHQDATACHFHFM